MKRLIAKHTCFYCNKTVDKANLYRVVLTTKDGPHELGACKDCADDFNDLLKDIEEVKNAEGI